MEMTTDIKSDLFRQFQNMFSSYEGENHQNIRGYKFIKNKMWHKLEKIIKEV